MTLRANFPVNPSGVTSSGGGGGSSSVPLFVNRGTANYTVAPADGDRQAIVVDASAGLRTVTLPGVVAAAGVEVRVAKSDASGNAVRLAAQAGENIEAANTYDLTAQHESVIAWSDGAVWRLS